MSEEQPRSLIAVLAMFAAAVPFELDMYLPGLPAIASDLGTGAGDAARRVKAFLFGLALDQLLIGPLSNKYGRRAMLGVSPSIITAASVACALATNIVSSSRLRDSSVRQTNKFYSLWLSFPGDRRGLGSKRSSSHVRAAFY
jgi:MFS family permease